jgi:hypothetical protein
MYSFPFLLAKYSNAPLTRAFSPKSSSIFPGSRGGQNAQGSWVLNQAPWPIPLRSNRTGGDRVLNRGPLETRSAASLILLR